MWQIWLMLAGVFLIIEILTAGFLVFWLSIGALLTMIVSFFTDNIAIQTAFFVISSTLLIFLTKPFVKKFVNSKDNIPTNIFSLIGKQGIVIQNINNDLGTGQIKVNGEVWTAQSEDDNCIISKDEKVEILKVDGVKLIVTTSKIKV